MLEIEPAAQEENVGADNCSASDAVDLASKLSANATNQDLVGDYNLKDGGADYGDNVRHNSHIINDCADDILSSVPSPQTTASPTSVQSALQVPQASV